MSKKDKRHASVAKAGKPEAAGGDVRRGKRSQHHRDTSEGREGVRQGRQRRKTAKKSPKTAPVEGRALPPITGTLNVTLTEDQMARLAVPDPEPLPMPQRVSKYRNAATMHRQAAQHLDQAAGFASATNDQMEAAELARAAEFASLSNV